MPQTIGKLSSRAILPVPPKGSDDPLTTVRAILLWAERFHDAVGIDLWDLLAKALVFQVGNKGTVAFGAADTSKAVAFDGREPDTDYTVMPVVTWNTTAWITSKTVTGFTFNVGTAPGGAGATAEWGLIR